MWTTEEQRMLNFLWKYGKSVGRKYLRWDFNFDDDPWDGLNISKEDFDTDMNFMGESLTIPTKIRDFLFKFYEEKIEPEVEVSFNKILDTVVVSQASNYELFIIIDLQKRKISAVTELNYYTESDEQIFELELPNEVYESLISVIDDKKIQQIKVSYEGSGDSGAVSDTFMGQGQYFDTPSIVERFINQNLPGGWENNEGAQGFAFFDLEDKSVTINHVENIYESASDTILELDF
jgi:hypothetical protein